MKNSLTLFWSIVLGIGMLVACQHSPLVFQLVQSHEIPLQETDTLTINNCGNILARPVTQWYQGQEGITGVQNLRPTGQEPFPSIRHRMKEVYGDSDQPFFLLTVPADTHRTYTFTIDAVRYRGEVTGEVIDANKERLTTPAFYSYWVRRKVALTGFEDTPCP